MCLFVQRMKCLIPKDEHSSARAREDNLLVKLTFFTVSKYLRAGMVTKIISSPASFRRSPSDNVCGKDPGETIRSAILAAEGADSWRAVKLGRSSSAACSPPVGRGFLRKLARQIRSADPGAFDPRELRYLPAYMCVTCGIRSLSGLSVSRRVLLGTGTRRIFRGREIILKWN